MLENGTTIFTSDDYFETTPLITSLQIKSVISKLSLQDRQNMIDTANLILNTLEKDGLKHTLYINKEDIFGHTALLNACDLDDVDIVKRLLENGANLEYKNKEGKTAVIWANENSKKKVGEFIKNYK